MDCVFAVTRAGELLSLPAGPRAESKRRLLAEYLRNPFLDDDLHALTLRLGAARAEVGDLLLELCQEGLLKESGRRGYLLDLDGVATGGDEGDPGQGIVSLPPEALIAQQSTPVSGAADALPLAGDPASPAVGIVLLGAGGRAELANDQAAEWLGVPATELDAATFQAATGIDPTLVLDGAPRASLSLHHPRPLRVALHSCCVGGSPGVLAVLQESGAAVELARVQAQVQEELYTRLRGEVAEPVLLIQQFLEEPTAEGLGQARAALEQVNRFLEEFMLSGADGATDRPCRA